MNRVKRLGACASFELLPGGVLSVEWSGVVTLRAAGRVKREICAALQQPAGAVVSDYRHAVVAMDQADLQRIMVGGAHDLSDLPAFVVASDVACGALYRAAVTAALRGRWRHVSRDPRQALRLAIQLRVTPALLGQDHR